MNLIKRAWWRLTTCLVKTTMLTGLFLVICTLVLSGFLIQAAASRAAEDAKEEIGAIATMQLDVNGLIDSGKGQESEGQQVGRIGEAGDLHRSLVKKICASSVVEKCNYSTEGGAYPAAGTELHQPVPPPDGQGGLGTDLFTVSGVLDSAQSKDFRSGDSEIVDGRGITPGSKDDEILIEERLAKDNGLEPGDSIKLMVGQIPGPEDERNTSEYTFKVVGIYKNSTPDSGSYVPAVMDPANQLYATPGGGSLLNGKKAADPVLDSATFTLKDPAHFGRLKKDARSAGADLDIFPITVNDKQYQSMVGPITRTAGFATLTVWLVAVAGTVILGLIVASSLRERRKELGILLSLGESRPRLLGQHLLEVAACALIAVGLAAAGSQVLSQSVGNALLAQEVSSAAQDENDSTGSPSEYSDTGDGTQRIGSEPSAEDDMPAPDPITSMDVRLRPADIAKVGATGLGIAALATLLPGVRILRLNPRDILTKGE
ncbi:ABC transporter permease [Streptomyces sp. NPDC048290]|uniref:ABC transporter permease n=1 Tax=Streptomyces sp. NPDC048290 TaxID=3155811 RepID=UPI003444E38B